MLILVQLWFMHIILLIPFLYLSLFGILLKLHLLVNYGVPSNTRYAFQIGIIASFICYSMQLLLLYYHYLFKLITVIIIILLIISFIFPFTGIVWLRWKQINEWVSEWRNESFSVPKVTVIRHVQLGWNLHQTWQSRSILTKKHRNFRAEGSEKILTSQLSAYLEFKHLTRKNQFKAPI